MAFKKAVKERAKLRLAFNGLAGSGKTFSMLAIASAMAKLMRDAGTGDGRIAVIDTERGSASLYADKFDFDVLELDSYSPLAYVDAIKEAEANGYSFVLIDSLTHAWAGKDGALDQKDKAADRDPRGNSWTAWRNVTPKHNALVDAMLTSTAHVIATMRQKMEFVQEKNEHGKTEIRKVGLASIQREGMEYEFTIVGDIDLTHTLKISKTRCDGIDVGDLFEKPGETFARRVYAWLTSGVEAPARPVAPPTPASKDLGGELADAASKQTPPNSSGEPAGAPVPSLAAGKLDAQLDDAFDRYLAAMPLARTLPALDAAAGGPGKPAKGTPQYDRAAATYLACKAAIEKAAAKAEQSAQAGAA